MAALKICDLSVGDWIQDGNGIIAKVRGIEDWSNGYILNVQSVSGSICTLSSTGALPIPLTPEILEKIGFEKTPDLFTAYHADKVWISYNKRSETWDVTIHSNNALPTLYVKILHVHQLQHALRLAGVDKEINL